MRSTGRLLNNTRLLRCAYHSSLRRTHKHSSFLVIASKQVSETAYAVHPDVFIVSAEGFLNHTTLTGSIHHAMTSATTGGGVRFHNQLEPLDCSGVTIPHEENPDAAFPGYCLSDPDELAPGLQQ